MKLSSKIISCFCLFIYLLFGLLNTGGMSFCLGSEHSRHFGINFLGYESCCKSEHIVADENNLTTSHKLPSISTHCNCDDEYIQTSNVSQNTLTKMSLDELFNNIDIIQTQLIAYYINFNKSEHIAKISSRHRIMDNCVPRLETVVLTI